MPVAPVLENPTARPGAGADEPEPLPIEAFARMKSPPDADDEAPPPELLDALLEAPLPDCRQPVNVISGCLRFSSCCWSPDCPEVEPEVAEPVEEPAPEPAPIRDAALTRVDPPDCEPVAPPDEPELPPDWADTPTASAAVNIVLKINCRFIQTS